ncbi:MAG: 6-phosphofructokinase [Anaerolineae bacterium]|nr:6-phosphofructokinase [Anaerolineae bacterium]
MLSEKSKTLAVLTSGGDSQGMNAALRAIVRTALDRGVEIYAIYEGYQGMVDGGDNIRKMAWDSVGGILHQGGTVIGSARCKEFRTREGRRQAAYNLIAHGINSLVVIGGDGSLTGANIFRQEWTELLDELVEQGKITREVADANPQLAIVGLVGSIDNDMFGTDMTIGADTALHRIVEAVDAIVNTASSHQRTFVIEVMGRHCGYLALVSALATGADWVLIPESPPNVENWENKMCEVLMEGRRSGRRNSTVIVAEGACDINGTPITSEYVKKVLEERLGADTRVTILGHVQRGGAPSAFDRNLGTLLGHAAVNYILSVDPSAEPQLIGFHENSVTHVPLMDCVQKTHQVAELIAAKEYSKAMELRGASFKEIFRTFRTLVRAKPHQHEHDQAPKRLAILCSGAPAPGMNTAAWVAVRLGLDKGYIVLGIENGFDGLIEGHIREMDWMSVNGWASRGGAELGTHRRIPQGKDFYAVARHLEQNQVQGLLIVGGWSGYESAYQMHIRREEFPAFNIPMVCLPATINNNLPGTELSVGADTALNNIVEAVDKIKQSAVASRRCFVVEVMGRYCGYLALMSGLATGAERVYLHEEGVTLRDLQNDVELLLSGFRHSKRLGLMLRNERANELYTTAFMSALFEEEGSDLFDVRQAILGHLQQGGDPSPFDRNIAARLAARCVQYLGEKMEAEVSDSAFIGMLTGKLQFTRLDDFQRMVDYKYQRPKEQWWLKYREIAKVMAKTST